VKKPKDTSLFFSNFRRLRISRADGAGDLSNFHFIGYNIGDVNYSFRDAFSRSKPHLTEDPVNLTKANYWMTWLK
jgi:hypothetical protein